MGNEGRRDGGGGRTGTASWVWCLAHLELTVDAEVKALIPDGVAAVLDCACLEPVARGRGQPQCHIAVRGGHCRKEGAPAMAQSPSQPSCPKSTSFHHRQPQEA